MDRAAVGTGVGLRTGGRGTQMRCRFGGRSYVWSVAA